MTLGEKLSRLRREHNYTQEQLGALLGVSRQSVGKWESDNAFPETDKLIRLSDLYDCSLDYLLRDRGEETSPPPTIRPMSPGARSSWPLCWERKSSRTVLGMPLWHISIGFISPTAKGVFAVGYRAKGIFSVGLLSVGVFSFGVLSLGLLSLGVLALGLLAGGSIAVGILAAGAVSFGVVALGSLSVGLFSTGALAIGQYIAIGDHAQAAIAIGDSQAAGTVFQTLKSLTPEERQRICRLLEDMVPWYLTWARRLFQLFL